MSIIPNGYTHSQETRAKISAAHKGKIRSPEHRANISAAQKGRIFSPERRAKMSAARMGSVVSPETRAKIAASWVVRKKRSGNIGGGATTPCSLCREPRARKVRLGRTHTFCSKVCRNKFIERPAINGTIFCRTCSRTLPVSEFSRRLDIGSKRGYVSRCKWCNAIATEQGRRPYRVYKGTHCVLCGFIPVHSCQLDVDHIDGSKKNGDPSNLQTLCANCHRLKTVMEGNWRHAKEHEPIRVGGS